MKKIYGKIHSIETLGTRDGPGLRCVFFMSGCNFRCKFCHNPDTFTTNGARLISLEEAEEKLRALLPYLRMSHGGVTASGGEPALQADFVRGLFKLTHRLGLTTALDTNGSCPYAKIKGLLSVTDTVLLDVKASTDKLHKWITGVSIKNTLQFAEATSCMQAVKGAPELVIRRVILPGINDTQIELETLSDFMLALPARPKIELLKYHTMGVYKWEELDLKYKLLNLKPPTRKQFERVVSHFAEKGFVIIRDIP